MEFLIAVTAVFSVLVVGVLLTWVITRFDGAVQSSKIQLDNQSYNPAFSLGHAIDLGASSEQQVKEARLLAARKAAVTPRGANMGIGRLGQSTLKTAAKAVESDPWTAAKIAQFHGWDGTRSGYVAAAPAATAGGAAAVSVPKPTLIEITDDMAPDEKRKARVANAKANSAYKKALKAAGAASSAPQTAAAPAPAAAVPTVTAVPANIAPPDLIEITDDMTPEEKRKARVANAKANSAYKKALKAAGVDPKAAAAPAPAPAAAAPAPAAPAPAIPANAPPPPDLIEITDGMAPDEIRRARIANAKAKSAYKKALKEAGIDPATVKI
ncbi:MAG: hypothetical protein ACE5FD_08775 [Anaerolineae bacterium]